MKDYNMNVYYIPKNLGLKPKLSAFWPHELPPNNEMEYTTEHFPTVYYMVVFNEPSVQ